MAYVEAPPQYWPSLDRRKPARRKTSYEYTDRNGERRIAHSKLEANKIARALARHG